MYTRHIAKKLVEREIQQANLFADAVEMLAIGDTDLDCNLNLIGQILEGNNTIPVVLIDEANRIEDYRNIGEGENGVMDTAEVRKALNRMIRQGADTIPVQYLPDIDKKLIYSHSELLTLLNLYPFVQLFLIAVFIGFGYMGFSASRRAEENLVWLGMAKETAHQLGTPITAILGWLEALKSANEDQPVNLEMLNELGTDVNRLELVADRFSKIGAQPELRPANVYEQLEKCRDYMQRRSPRKITLDFPNPEEHEYKEVYINAHLFDWVVENILRNAIDAMEEGVGVITVTVYDESEFVCIDLQDTGKGIAANRLRTVFKPGYSTKKRGWGLGLSLSKRIIEQYHKGKIFVKKSEPNKGSTFTIKLPAAPPKSRK